MTCSNRSDIKTVTKVTRCVRVVLQRSSDCLEDAGLVAEKPLQNFAAEVLGH